MNKNNCSIKFFLNERVKDSSKGFPIYCRIILNRKKAEFATDEFCPLSKWDRDNGIPIRNPRIKEYIAHVENEIFEIKRKLEYQKKHATAKILKQLYKNQTSEEAITLLRFFDQFINRISLLPEDYSKSRVSKYKTCKRYLTDFLTSKKCKSITIEEFDLNKIQQYDIYLATNIISPNTQKPIIRNTINTHHKMLKTVLNEAVKNEIIISSPYKNFKLKHDKTDRAFLDNDELEILRKIDLSEKLRFDKVRDIFIFSCFTGMRFQDAQDLKNENITIDSNNKYWLTFTQSKTNRIVRLPLLNPAIEIYHKYDHYRKVTKKILPKISNQKFNDYIKVVAGYAKIKKTLSHHIARHTFATTVTLSNDIPIEVVSSMLGHTSLKTTQIYAKITDDYKLKQIERLNKII